MKTIYIPKEINYEWGSKNFPLISKYIMSEFYKENKKNTRMVEPKDKSFSFIHPNDGTITDIVKCKLRIDMPKDKSTFMIDTCYVKEMKKYMNNHSYSKTRGLLVFPIISERSIYMINIDKLTKEMIGNEMVNNTYSETSHLREGEYYFIPKNICAKFKMSNEINFEVITPKKEEVEETHKNTLF